MDDFRALVTNVVDILCVSKTKLNNTFSNAELFYQVLRNCTTLPWHPTLESLNHFYGRTWSLKLKKNMIKNMILIKPLTTIAPKKPVNWSAVQIIWLGSTWRKHVVKRFVMLNKLISTKNNKQFFPTNSFVWKPNKWLPLFFYLQFLKLSTKNFRLRKLNTLVLKNALRFPLKIPFKILYSSSKTILGPSNPR